MKNFILFIIFLSTKVIYTGWVTTKLWLWFIVPFGISVITLSHAIGIMVLVALLTHQNPIKVETETSEEKTTALIATFFIGMLTSSALLLIGWIVS